MSETRSNRSVVEVLNMVSEKIRGSFIPMISKVRNIFFSEPEVSGEVTDIPIYRERTIMIGSIEEKTLDERLIKWSKVIPLDEVNFELTPIIESFFSKVLGGKREVMSITETANFYEKMEEFFGKDRISHIYIELLSRDMIAFNLGSISGKVLEKWLFKMSDGNSRHETLVINSFIDEVLGGERAILSNGEMAFLNNKLRKLFGRGIAEYFYRELRFKNMLHFKT